MVRIIVTILCLAVAGENVVHAQRSAVQRTRPGSSRLNRRPNRGGSFWDNLWSSPARRDAEVPASSNVPDLLGLFGRQSNLPNMFGDSFIGGTVAADLGLEFGIVDLPLAGGSRRVKVAENNKAVPMDRLSFSYHHFHNARQIRRTPLGMPAAVSSLRSLSVDQWTIGFEKTFFDRWSVELRMPFVNDPDVVDGAGFGTIVLDGGQVGNLSVMLKRLLSVSQWGAVSAGLGVNTPTGSNLNLNIAATNYFLQNDAVHLLPFIGFQSSLDETFFVHGFAQLDVAANGNRIQQLNGLFAGNLGQLREPTLMYLDVSLGAWLFRDPCACRFKGLAAIVEMHYAGTLENSPSLSNMADPVFGNQAGRFDVLNVTVGLHAEIGQTRFRLAAVAPLRDDYDRFFDSEIMVQVNRQF